MLQVASSASTHSRGMLLSHRISRHHGLIVGRLLVAVQRGGCGCREVGSGRTQVHAGRTLFGVLCCAGNQQQLGNELTRGASCLSLSNLASSQRQFKHLVAACALTVCVCVSVINRFSHCSSEQQAASADTAESGAVKLTISSSLVSCSISSSQGAAAARRWSHCHIRGRSCSFCSAAGGTSSTTSSCSRGQQHC